MKGLKPWRVRVKRQIEDWVEVPAHDAVEAEQKAGELPSVTFVFKPSALPADKLASASPRPGVEE